MDYKTAVRAGMLIAVLAALPLEARANMFSDQDVRELGALNKRIIAARQGITQTQRIPNDYPNEFDCLLHINQALESMERIFSEITDLITISSAMADRRDEGIVNKFLAGDIKAGPSYLALSRQGVSLEVARCGGAAIVVNNAQIASSIFDESERILSALGGRF
jgi:hypothetical protein